jgi:hypothetical protein
MPCLLAWKLRGNSDSLISSKKNENFIYENFVPGGNTSLLVILALTGFVIFQKLV